MVLMDTVHCRRSAVLSLAWRTGICWAMNKHYLCSVWCTVRDILIEWPFYDDSRVFQIYGPQQDFSGMTGPCECSWSQYRGMWELLCSNLGRVIVYPQRGCRGFRKSLQSNDGIPPHLGHDTHLPSAFHSSFISDPSIRRYIQGVSRL
jgi:hypothetical protein